MVTMVG